MLRGSRRGELDDEAVRKRFLDHLGESKEACVTILRTIGKNLNEIEEAESKFKKAVSEENAQKVSSPIVQIEILSFTLLAISKYSWI